MRLLPLEKQHFNPLCPERLYCLYRLCSLSGFSPAGKKTTAAVFRAYCFHFYLRQSYQIFAHLIKKMNWKYCCRFFNKYDSFTIFQQSVKDEDFFFFFFDMSLLLRRLWVGSIEVSVKTVCYFHTILPTGLAHFARVIWICTESAISGSKLLYSSTNTSSNKPPWICNVGAYTWCRRKSQSIKKLGEICPESHTWEQLKKMGCSYLPSFFSMHSFTTSKTSLMKRCRVPDPELDAGLNGLIIIIKC